MTETKNIDYKALASGCVLHTAGCFGSSSDAVKDAVAVVVREIENIAHRWSELLDKRHRLASKLSNRYDAKAFEDLNKTESMALQLLQDEIDLREQKVARVIQTAIEDLHPRYQAAADAYNALPARLRQALTELGLEVAGLEGDGTILRILNAWPAIKTAERNRETLAREMNGLRGGNKSFNDENQFRIGILRKAVQEALA